MRDDPATINLIYDWFQLRRINDNDNFPIFFKRYINMYYPKYIAMADAERAKIDPLVNFSNLRTDVMTEFRDIKTKKQEEINEALNRINSSGGTRSSAMDEQNGIDEQLQMIGGEEINKTYDNEKDEPEVSERESWQGYAERETEGQSSNKAAGNDNDSVRLDKAMPQSMQYAAAAGTVPALDWSAPSAQSEQKQNAASDDGALSASERERNIEGVHLTERLHEGLITEKGTEHTDSQFRNRVDDRQGTGNLSRLESEDILNNDDMAEMRSKDGGSNEDKADNASRTSDIQESGMRGILQSDAYWQYYDYLNRTNALKWFIDHLAPCFALDYSEPERPRAWWEM